MWGTVLGTVRCIAASWPLPKRCQQSPLLPPIKNVSGHCQVSPGGQDHPELRTTVLEGRATLDRPVLKTRTQSPSTDVKAISLWVHPAGTPHVQDPRWSPELECPAHPSLEGPSSLCSVHGNSGPRLVRVTQQVGKGVPRRTQISGRPPIWLSTCHTLANLPHVTDLAAESHWPSTWKRPYTCPAISTPISQLL